LALLGERVLNASAEAQHAAARFHQLDVKFRELAQLVSQQSGLIARLERLCPGGAAGQQQVTAQPLLGAATCCPHLFSAVPKSESREGVGRTLAGSRWFSL
jgi:hypothetical protein